MVFVCVCLICPSHVICTRMLCTIRNRGKAQKRFPPPREEREKAKSKYWRYCMRFKRFFFEKLPKPCATIILSHAKNVCKDIYMYCEKHIQLSILKGLKSTHLLLCK